MKNYRLILSLVLGAMVTFSFSCVKKMSDPMGISYREALMKPKDTSKVPVYFALVGHGDDFTQFLKNNNLPVVKVLDDKMIMGEGFTIDYKKLDSHIAENFPNPKDSGMCFIDIEDPYINVLATSSPGSADFNRSLNLFVTVIKYCKSVRPNVKWGHYGMPRTTFEDPKILPANKYLGPIYQASDVLFPSLYLFRDDIAVDYQVNYDYLNKNLTEALKIGKQYNKPVIPFVMNRFHNSDPRQQFLKMTDAYWKRYINSILSIKYNNKGVDGIVWWGADTYFFSSPTEGNNLRKEFRGSVDAFKKFNDQNLIHDAQILIKTVDNR